MTAIQQNTMHTELLQSIGAIAGNTSLMQRLTRYAKKLAKEQSKDETLFSEDEFFARVEHSKQQAKEGKVHRIEDKEQLTQFLNSL